MQNYVKQGLAVVLLSAVGIGCYSWGQHKPVEPVSPYPTALQTPSQTTTTTTNSPQGTSSSTTTSALNAATQPNASSSLADPQLAGSSLRSVAPLTPIAQPSTVSSTTTSSQMTPVTTAAAAAVPYAGTTTVTPVDTTTVVEKKTVVTPTTHTAYTQRTVHYKHHKTDKVHVARATKHGAMFALKLPGRLAF